MCESPAGELLCRWYQVLGWAATTRQSNIQWFLLLVMSGRQVSALSFGWVMNNRKENEYTTKLVFLLLIWCVWWTQSNWNMDVVGNFQDYRYDRYCMHAVHSYGFMGHRQDFRWQTTGEHCWKKPTPQNTHLHEGRMLGHDSSMVSLRAAVTTKGCHQRTSSFRQHQR